MEKSAVEKSRLTENKSKKLSKQIRILSDFLYDRGKIPEAAETQFPSQTTHYKEDRDLIRTGDFTENIWRRGAMLSASIGINVRFTTLKIEDHGHLSPSQRN